MRIRSTKPEFWRSKRIASVSWEARLVLKGLESYVDDNGVGLDDVALIASDVFPRDLARESPGTLRKVSDAISELCGQGLVHRYRSGDDNYLFLSWWESAQYINKPNRGRFPRPDGTLEYGDSLITGASPESPGKVGTSPVGTGEQGNRGTEEIVPEISHVSAPDVSSEIANAIPRRDDVERLLDLLDDEIRRNGSKVPKRTKQNIDAMRLMLDRDGHTEQQVATAIRWCQANEFWRSNILSASKLREKYDQLRLQASRQRDIAVLPTRALQKQERNLSVVQRMAARDAADQRGLQA